MNRTGIILAAGLGSRIKETLGDSRLIKPLTSVDGLILLMRTIYSLEKTECNEIIIVLGYQAEKIKNYIKTHYSGKTKLRYTINRKYHLQNGLSVLCARPFVDDEFVLTMADHILDDRIMELVKVHRPPANGITLCADFKVETIFDIDDATKVLSENGYIKNIGKDLTQFNCIDTGVFVATTGLMDAIESIYRRNGDASLSQGVQALAIKKLAMILDIKDAFWQDVDTLDMLIHAEKLLSCHDTQKIRLDLN